MNLRLRELARRALRPRRGEEGDAEIERIVLDVRRGERVDMVTLSVREDRLMVLATDGTAATSIAATDALAWLAADLPRTSLAPERAERPADGSPSSSSIDVAIADLVTAVVRAGSAAADTPAIADALARIGSASPSLEVARWVGRVRAALAARDEVLLARWLDGARAIDLKEEPTRMVDRVLVELGRELLDGLTPLAIERRHLFDPTTGELFAEERLRDQSGASNGPSPRVVSVGLAMRTATARVRIVQYAVATLDADMLARVDSFAVSLSEAFARSLTEGLRSPTREPVALLRIEKVEDGRVFDATLQPIPLARHEDAAAVTALFEALGRGAPGWLLGRWSLSGDDASLVPLSCCVDGRFMRLR